MKKIPAKFSRCGIKIKCLKCTSHVNETCPLKNKGINSCEHKNKHKYIFIVHIPKTRNSRITKLAKSDHFNEALMELITFKEELKNRGYHRAEKQVKTIDNSVAGLMKEFLN